MKDLESYNKVIGCERLKLTKEIQSRKRRTHDQLAQSHNICNFTLDLKPWIPKIGPNSQKNVKTMISPTT